MANTMTNTEAMAQTREGWKLVDVHHTSMLVPGPYREYLKGLCTVLNALQLLHEVEQHNELVLEAFSDKVPRLPFTATDLLVMARRTSNADDAASIEEMQAQLVERQECQKSAKEAMEEGDEIAARYWFARDYGLAYLLRGAYKVLTEKEAGRGLPEQLSVDLLATLGKSDKPESDEDE